MDGYIEIKPGAVLAGKAGAHYISRGGRWRPHGPVYRRGAGAGLSRETKAELLGVKISLILQDLTDAVRGLHGELLKEQYDRTLAQVQSAHWALTMASARRRTSEGGS